MLEALKEYFTEREMKEITKGREKALRDLFLMWKKNPDYPPFLLIVREAGIVESPYDKDGFYTRYIDAYGRYWNDSAFNNKEPVTLYVMDSGCIYEREMYPEFEF
jgi:hypothetical protein